MSEQLDIVDHQLDIVLAHGFSCLLCNSTQFSFNAMGLVICGECGNVYHIHALEKIYK